MVRDALQAVLEETGSTRWPAFYRDSHFYLILAAGAVVLGAMGLSLPGRPAPESYGLFLLLSLIVGQPIVEELLFRGIIQGQLGRLTWAAREWLGISFANVVTSGLFVLMHLIHHPLAWALAIFIPSLVFGYVWDRYRSIYPPILVHSFYNLGYLFTIAV